MLRVTSGQLEDRLATHLFGDVAQEQAVVAAILHVWRERPGRTSAQFEIQTKIANDFLREQADQIRVARQMRVVVREHFLRSRRAADVIVLLQQQHTQTRARQISRCHESIVPGTKDDHVVLSFHVL